MYVFGGLDPFSVINIGRALALRCVLLYRHTYPPLFCVEPRYTVCVRLLCRSCWRMFSCVLLLEPATPRKSDCCAPGFHSINVRIHRHVCSDMYIHSYWHYSSVHTHLVNFESGSSFAAVKFDTATVARRTQTQTHAKKEGFSLGTHMQPNVRQTNGTHERTSVCYTYCVRARARSKLRQMFDNIPTYTHIHRTTSARALTALTCILFNPCWFFCVCARARAGGA